MFKRATLATLILGSMALAGCASHGSDHGGSDTAYATPPVSTGILQPGLTNTGQAVDNILPAQLASSLGGVGKSLDKALDPTLRQVRPEEQTSELQSLMRTSYALFRFKKKKL